MKLFFILFTAAIVSVVSFYKGICLTDTLYSNQLYLLIDNTKSARFYRSLNTKTLENGVQHVSINYMIHFFVFWVGFR